MVRFVGHAIRDLYRRERWPASLRRLLVAEGMCEFYRTLARGLARPLALARAGADGAAEP
ncbi:MAG: hypothetical protein HY908_13275, partial [Myxococcales bacterium]|nr:hypothetical protein [Myxococcales bacterium]